MTPAVAATAYAVVGFTPPFVVLPRIAPLPFLARCFAAWFLTALILFFIDDQLAVLALAGVVLAVLMPSEPIQRVGFFLVAAPCLPAYLQVYLPFPGINWLVLLTYYKVLVLVLFVPLLLRMPAKDSKAGGFSFADACVLLYVALTVVLVTAQMGPTAGPRFLIDQTLILAVPYFVLSRFVRTEEDLDFCLRALLLSAVILASIAVMATLKQWDFYRLKEPASVFLIPDTRSGLIRISATANTHSLGFLLAIGLLVLECLKKALGLSFLKLWMFRGLLFVGLLTTDSRGALLGLSVAYAIYGILMIRRSGMRWVMLLTLVAVVIGAGIWLVTTEDASSVDAYNSVGYRQLLLQVSLDYILKNPIIGDLGYLSDPSFAVLRQGQGIIDITNFYLQIGLSFGLLGLILLAGVFAPTMRRLMRLILGTTTPNLFEFEGLRRVSATLLAALVGWLLLVATTSDVALTFHAGLVLIALARAVTRFPQLQPLPVDPLAPGLPTIKLPRSTPRPSRAG